MPFGGGNAVSGAVSPFLQDYLHKRERESKAAAKCVAAEIPGVYDRVLTAKDIAHNLVEKHKNAIFAMVC